MSCTAGHGFYHADCGYCRMAQRDLDMRRASREAAKQTEMMRSNYKAQQREQWRAADRQASAAAEQARESRRHARREWMEQNAPGVVHAQERAKTALIWVVVACIAFAIFAQLFASYFWIFVLVGVAVAAVLYLRRHDNRGSGDGGQPPSDT